MPQKTLFIDVDLECVDQTGFFCYMSKRKTQGWACKLQWVKERLAEGMRIRFSSRGNRAFIEHIPGEFAWRPVRAKGYMVIHCLWVVGRSKGRGLAKRLIRECVDDAQESGMHGVAMVAGREWYMIRPEFLAKQGFRTVDTASPSFELMARKFDTSTNPCFVKDLAKRAGKYPRGLTVFTSDQCPYLVAATRATQAAARRLGLACTTTHLKNASDVRRLSPSPYGVFSIVCNGHVLSHYPIGENEIVRRIKQARLRPKTRRQKQG